MSVSQQCPENHLWALQYPIFSGVCVLLVSFLMWKLTQASRAARMLLTYISYLCVSYFVLIALLNSNTLNTVRLMGIISTHINCCKLLCLSSLKMPLSFTSHSRKTPVTSATTVSVSMTWKLIFTRLFWPTSVWWFRNAIKTWYTTANVGIAKRK